MVGWRNKETSGTLACRQPRKYPLTPTKVMGGIHEDDLLRMIGFTAMPVAEKQLQESHSDAYIFIANHLSYRWAVKDGEAVWVADELMARAIAKAEQNIEFWKKRIDYLNAQRQALAKRQLSPEPPRHLDPLPVS